MSGSDSELEMVPFEVAKQAEIERKKQVAEQKTQAHLKKQQQKEQIKQKIKKDKEIQLKAKQTNLFEDEPPEQSSSTQSHFTNNKIDESFQRNLNEKLSEKVIKSIKMPQIQQATTIPIEIKSKKIIKKFNEKVSIETLGREVNHKLNSQQSLSFLKQHLVDKQQRVPLSKIISKKK
ncbi:unnamed protein product [Paramecium octaurelia]|uniref:Uncharacterized protein n=1 Tax=Paramecium octaurelia TaxID=43137 RepID=A0A8S1WFN6_PAROT|nr:unnamed protein product [Paramecium octaurelia]